MSLRFADNYFPINKVNPETDDTCLDRLLNNRVFKNKFLMATLVNDILTFSINDILTFSYLSSFFGIFPRECDSLCRRRVEEDLNFNPQIGQP